MKKNISLIFLILFSVFLPRTSSAAWPDFTPLIPFSSQFCPMCVAPAISTAMSYYEQGEALKDDLEKYTDVTVIKQMATSYASKMGITAFNRFTQKKDKKKRVISHARTIEDSTVADVTDEVSVRSAFIKLFLQYPSQKTQTKQAYEILGRQLKMDTTLEMYITAVEMEKELYGTTTDGETIKSLENVGMLKQIDLIESCLVKGENCDIVGLKSCQEKIGSGEDDTREDQVCFWNSALQAERLYDSIMRDNLFLAAMHAQYKAVMGINQMVKIKEYEEESITDDKINAISNVIINSSHTNNDASITVDEDLPLPEPIDRVYDPKTGLCKGSANDATFSTCTEGNYFNIDGSVLYSCNSEGICTINSDYVNNADVSDMLAD